MTDANHCRSGAIIQRNLHLLQGVTPELVQRCLQRHMDAALIVLDDYPNNMQQLADFYSQVCYCD